VEASILACWMYGAAVIAWQPLMESQIETLNQRPYLSAPRFRSMAGAGDQCFLRAFVRGRLPVIPVMLPDSLLSQASTFLEGMVWVDFAAQIQTHDMLLWGITGTGRRIRLQPCSISCRKLPVSAIIDTLRASRERSIADQSADAWKANFPN